MPSLTALPHVKGALRIPAAATIHDVRIGEIIEEVESEILEQLDLSAFEPTTYNEILDTDPGGQRTFVVSKFPVLSVAALTISGSALVAGEQFSWHRSGRIRLTGQGATLPSSRQKVEISYTAGVVQTAGTTPAALRRWATLEATLQYNREHMAGFDSVTNRPLTTKMTKKEEDAVEHVLNRIRARYARIAG